MNKIERMEDQRQEQELDERKDEEKQSIGGGCTIIKVELGVERIRG
jgi:hypothetical protein